MLEILVASRSDPELAALVLPMQSEVERNGAANFLLMMGGNDLEMAPIRLVVWAIRGMTMGKTFIADPQGMEAAVALLSRLIEKAVPSGRYEDLAAI